MKLQEYESVAIFHTSNRCPCAKNKRVAYRTYVQTGGLKFISNIHLGIESGAIDWSSNCHHRIYDYVFVQNKNVLIEQAKTRKCL